MTTHNINDVTLVVQTDSEPMRLPLASLVPALATWAKNPMHVEVTPVRHEPTPVVPKVLPEPPEVTIEGINEAILSAGFESEIVDDGFYDGHGRWNSTDYQNITVTNSKSLAVRIDGGWTGLDDPEADTWRVVVDDEWDEDYDKVVIEGAEYFNSTQRTRENLPNLVEAVRTAMHHNDKS